MNKELPSILKSVIDCPIQAFYSDKYQILDIVQLLVERNNSICRELYMTTFSLSEEFIRKIYFLREKFIIETAVLIVDIKASHKISAILPFAKSTFDSVYLTQNHGKVILLDNISICTSQNQTRGNRREATVITSAASVYNIFHKEIIEIIKTGIKL
jgi:hypothetical protein